jgi:hypothetical protein
MQAARLGLWGERAGGLLNVKAGEYRLSGADMMALAPLL